MIKFESEKDLHDLIFENYHEIDHDLSFCDEIISEVSIGSYGRVDLLSWEVNEISKDKHEITINLYELKNVSSSYKELGQLCRYMTGLREIISKLYPSKTSFSINGFLICPKIELSDDFSLLYNFMSNNIHIVTFELDPFEGIVFDLCSKTYRKKNEDIPEIEDLIDGFREIYSIYVTEFQTTREKQKEIEDAKK